MSRPDLAFVLDRKIQKYAKPNVIKLQESTFLNSACDMMIKNNKDEVIVVDNNDHPIGIVTDEDVLKKTAEQFVNPSETTLGDIMVFPVALINENKTLGDSLDMMRQRKVRKLLVLSEDGNISGMLYKNTIINLIKESLVTGQEKRSSFWSIIWNLGIVLQFAGVLMFVPAIVSTILREYDVATGIFLMSTLLLVTGFFMNTYGKKQPLKIRDAAILVLSSFILLVLFGTIPHMFVSPFHSANPTEVFVNSFFESSAGFTTGGLDLIKNPENLPQSYTFFRGYTQFVGGLSFIYLIVTSFYPENKLHTIRSFISGRIPQLRELYATITILFTIYVVIIASLLFYFGDHNILDNFSLAMSGVSTGGWIPNSHILDNMTVPQYAIITGGMILGALPFGFHYAFVRTKFMSVHLTKEVTTYFVILGLSAIFLLASSNAKPIDAIFNAISGSTTTGFQTISFTGLNPISWFTIIIVMIIGGCGFSTAGGMKVFRLMRLSELKHLIKRGNTYDTRELITAIILLAAFPSIAFIFALHVESLGFTFEDSFFDSMSALTTTGLGAGTVTVGLDVFTKMGFAWLMIFGRLEIILLVYIFVPRMIP